jgi:hypothetical protein
MTARAGELPEADRIVMLPLPRPPGMPDPCRGLHGPAVTAPVACPTGGR